MAQPLCIYGSCIVLGDSPCQPLYIYGSCIGLGDSPVLAPVTANTGY